MSRRGRRGKYNSRRGDGNDEDDLLKFRTGGIQQYHHNKTVREQLHWEVVQMDGFCFQISDMLHHDREVDFDALKPTPPVPVMIRADNTPEDVTLATKEEEEAQYNRKTIEEIKYSVELEFWFEQKAAYEAIKAPLCALILRRCDQDLMDALKRHSYYHEFSVKDPLLLLHAINDECLKEHEYPIAVQARIMEQTFNLFQKKDESVGEYACRAKKQWDLYFLVVDIGSTPFLQRTMEDFDSKTTQEQEEHNKNSKERLKAYMLLAHSDQQRFGDTIDYLDRQYSLGRNLYPATFSDAWNVLRSLEYNASNHLIDTDIDRTFDNLQGRCHVCGKKGHFPAKCYKKDSIPKYYWFLEQVKRNERS
jgi:hypothetical protein